MESRGLLKADGLDIDGGPILPFPLFKPGQKTADWQPTPLNAPTTRGAYGVSSLIVRPDIGNVTYPTPGNNSLKIMLAKPISLISVDGNYLTGGPGGEYLQLHDTTLLLANAVPAYSFLLAYAGPISLPSISATMSSMFFRYGLTIAISSTDSTYTASASTMDLFVTYEVTELNQPPGTWNNNAGDLSTTRNSLAVWGDGSGLNRLQRVIVQEQLGADRYVRIEADDSAAFDSAVFQRKIMANQTIQIDFGTDGLIPLKVNPADHTLHAGCTVRVVDGPTYPGAQTANSAIIFAINRPFHDSPYW